MSLVDNLREMERTREAYWLRHASTSPIKLRWRAVTVRHCFHVVPGESILELGAGSGLWTEHLTSALRAENPVTAAVFNADFAEQTIERRLPNTDVLLLDDLEALPPESFDYVVGTAILCHNRYAENLRHIHRVLKPGGQLLFFEANYWNPQVLAKSLIPAVGRWAGNARCQVGMRKFRLMKTASHQGFTDIEVIPYDIVHARTPERLIPAIQETAFVLEHLPGIREACGTLYIWASKRADAGHRRPAVNLASHTSLHGSTSVVVPCRNEEMNVPRLVRGLREAYDEYIAEIIIVNDQGEDATAEVTRRLAAEEPRLRLIERPPPGGVGRALEDGYAAARGKYILSMDCDFQLIIPELRDLFDVIAEGHAGAIGSRFSHESVLINYPFAKIIANRAFHLLVRLVLRRRIRDVSNNLKLYRAEIFKELDITRPDFGANAETGLGPLLAGYDIQEVPISWINRTDEMGTSDFRILRFAPSYLRALIRLLRSAPRKHTASGPST
jgi:SAM-dependent methyltransferase